MFYVICKFRVYKKETTLFQLRCFLRAFSYYRNQRSEISITILLSTKNDMAANKHKYPKAKKTILFQSILKFVKNRTSMKQLCKTNFFSTRSKVNYRFFEKAMIFYLHVQIFLHFVLQISVLLVFSPF